MEHCAALPTHIKTDLPKLGFFNPEQGQLPIVSYNEVFFVMCANEDEKRPVLVNTLAGGKGNQQPE